MSEVAELEEPVKDFKLDKRYVSAFLRGLKPLRRLNVAQWAEAYRVLGKGVSVKSGKWSNEVTPYLIPIMNCLGVFSKYQEIVFMKGAQIGATAAGENFVGYYMHIAPRPMLIMYPTVKLAETNSKRRISTLIADSPVLRNLISTAKSRDGSNTILEKFFPGGSIKLVGANSGTDLRSVSVCILLMDEIDEYPADLGGQGDPIEVARKRTATYDRDKKILFISTPTVKGRSHIERAFNKTDQNHFYLPCPHCCPDAPLTKEDPESWMKLEAPPGYQKLVLEQFRFTPKRPSAVYYECVHCKKEIHNYHKDYMLPRFVCVPDDPENINPLVIGFHLNAFYSPTDMYSWETMAADYERALEDPMKMRAFVQTTLGLPHEEEGDQPPYQHLFERSRNSFDANEVPEWVGMLTAGFDVQKDRVEVSIHGWGPGKRNATIDYRIIAGNIMESKTKEQLAAILSETWVRADGTILGLSFSLMDEGGHNKNDVYEFCLEQGAQRIMPVKGNDPQTVPVTSPKPVYIKRDGKKTQSLVHVTVSTDFYKSAIYAALNLKLSDDSPPEGPPMFCHFAKTFDLEHYKRLTCEKKVNTLTSNGYDKPKWTKPPGARNEQLDTFVYAYAAATMMGIDRFTDRDWLRMAGAFAPKPEVKKVVAPKKNNNNLPPIGPLM